MLLPIDVLLFIMYRAEILVTSSAEKITGIIILKREKKKARNYAKISRMAIITQNILFGPSWKLEYLFQVLFTFTMVVNNNNWLWFKGINQIS